MAQAKLSVIPGSHPSRTAMLMLERKGIPYKRIDLMPVLSKGIVRAQGFLRTRVPALKLEGTRVQGSIAIGRELDRIKPQPALYPADPEKRAKVEEIEAWGDDFQEKPRRLSWWAFRKDRGPLASFSEGARLGIPVGLAVKTGGPLVAAGSPAQRLDRCRGARRSEQPARRSRPNRSVDLRGSDRRTRSECRRLPARAEPAPADELRRPPALHRGTTVRGDGEPRGPGLPRARPAGSPGRLGRRPAPLERRPRDLLGPLPLAETVERRAQRRSVGKPQLRVELQQRQEDEPTRGHLGVREGEAGGAHLEVAQEEQVDVDRPRAVTGSSGGTAVLRLDGLAEIEKRLGTEGGADPNGAVQEVGLIEHLPHRLGLIERGDRRHLDPSVSQVVDRPAEVGFAVAEVRAEAEIADSRDAPRRAQRPSSSSDSRSSERSTVTSTAASCTG